MGEILDIDSLRALIPPKAEPPYSGVSVRLEYFVVAVDTVDHWQQRAEAAEQRAEQAESDAKKLEAPPQVPEEVVEAAARLRKDMYYWVASIARGYVKTVLDHFIPEVVPPEVPLADVIGGFPYADPNCKGCGKPLAVDNAWMTDGCPCNSELGINSMNETRWRLLMQLQQQQSRQSTGATP